MYSLFQEFILILVIIAKLVLPQNHFIVRLFVVAILLFHKVDSLLSTERERLVCLQKESIVSAIYKYNSHLKMYYSEDTHYLLEIIQRLETTVQVND